MIELSFETDVHCPADNVFDLIADLRGQDRWLTGSMSFHGTTEISADQVALGTTYRESEPLGIRNGIVTEFERPTTITFHQPMTLRLRAGVIDITVRYALTPRGGSTHLRRLVTLGIPWPMKLVRPIVVRAFRAESRRTLVALKRHADPLQ